MSTHTVDLPTIEKGFREIQDHICKKLAENSGANYNEDLWSYAPKGTGGGITRVWEGAEDNVIEKGGVNYSSITGSSLPPSALQQLKIEPGTPFTACGVSLVIHPSNPHVPTIHMNVRYFEAGDQWWFGGGIDLTPYYPQKNQVIEFHRGLKRICDEYGTPANITYATGKAICDEYFSLKHRGNEMRGVSGLFFDHLKEGKKEDIWNFIYHLGMGFTDLYIPFFKNKYILVTYEQREFQLWRRSRYVEFNLLWDRGTKFGITSEGRAESILMSLPTVAKWKYNYNPPADKTAENELINFYLKPQDWVNMGLDDIPAHVISAKNDLILRAAKRKYTERVPVWIMRQAGRYLPEYKETTAGIGFFNTCRNPEMVCKITIQPLLRFPLDAAIIFSDILVIPQAMGLVVEMKEGKGPFLPEPLLDPSHLARLTEKPDVDKLLGYVFEGISLTRKTLDGRAPLIGFSGAPWTLACYMIEGEGGAASTFSKPKAWLYKHPEALHSLLQRTTDVIVDYLVGQAKAGAQLLMVFDSWAGSMSPNSFAAFGLPYLAQIAQRVKAQISDEIPMICFAKGANFGLESLSKAGYYDVLGLDWTIQPSDARKLVGGRVALQGNLDPAVLFAGESVIREETKKMLQSFGTQGLIANLGHGMQPSMTPDMAGAYVKAVHDFSDEMNKN